MKAKKVVSLADELSTIQKAVEGAVLLLDGSVAETFDANRRQAAMGVLALVASRLHLVRSAIRGAADPKLLLGGHNLTAMDSMKGEDRDLWLRPGGGSERK